MKTPRRAPSVDNENGLTLVELMIAIAIISILAAIAVPNYIQGLPRKRLRDAARDLLSQMQLARLNAISENRQWAVEFDLANNRYCLVDSGANNTVDSAACVPVGDDVVSPPVMLASYGGQVQFSPNATAPNQCGNATATYTGIALNAASQSASLTFTNRGLKTGAATDSVYLTTNLGPPAANDVYCYSLSTSPGGGIKLRFYNGMTPFNQSNWME